MKILIRHEPSHLDLHCLVCPKLPDFTLVVNKDKMQPFFSLFYHSILICLDYFSVAIHCNSLEA